MTGRKMTTPSDISGARTITTCKSFAPCQEIILECEPPVWSFYREADSIYIHARPTRCWTDENGEWIEAVTTTKNKVIVALWVESVGEWCIRSMT